MSTMLPCIEPRTLAAEFGFGSRLDYNQQWAWKLCFKSLEEILILALDPPEAMRLTGYTKHSSPVLRQHE
jgi:hypothetical protein